MILFAVKIGIELNPFYYLSGHPKNLITYAGDGARVLTHKLAYVSRSKEFLKEVAEKIPDYIIIKLDNPMIHDNYRLNWQAFSSFESYYKEKCRVSQFNFISRLSIKDYRCPIEPKGFNGTLRFIAPLHQVRGFGEKS